MPATIERTIPQSLPKRAISKSPRERFIFPPDNESIRNDPKLRQAWLDSAVTFSPDDSEWTPEERKLQFNEWKAGMMALVEEIGRTPAADPRTLREILMEGRR